MRASDDEMEKREGNFLLRGAGPPSSVNSHIPRDSREWVVTKKCIAESMDFDEMESVMWRKHQLRRFFQDRGNWWTSSRRTTAWKWILVIITGVLVGCLGAAVQYSISGLMEIKFNAANAYVRKNSWASAFFSYLFICIVYSLVAGALCWIEPNASGSGIPEIKAYLNGVNLNRAVRMRTLITKAVGMCFSVAAGLPLGKEGPMIHTGSIVGASVSQGKTFTFGFDTSWTKFQDLRNDRSKRDFVTFGASAGVAAAFQAPIGGILFTLEEGASFWSTSLTFRSFFCAMMTMLTVSLIFNGFTFGRSVSVGFQFGTFQNADYRLYELLVFVAMGIGGGLIGALFNKIHERVSLFRMAHIFDAKWKRLSELLVITIIWTVISFVVPLMWQVCTPIPTETADWESQEFTLLNQLVQFQCPADHYNEVASLYFVNADTAMQQLFHYKEVDGSDYTTFSTGAILIFMIPYFFVAAVTTGTFCPAGLFVPTLLAGSAYGRLIGHLLNSAFPGSVASSGTYALIGASAVMGGVARMTIAGAVIVLEACGNSTFLLPLMLTFAAARYSGNAVNEPIYDMQTRLKEIPFLEGSLKTLGLLNYHPVVEIMATPVATLPEVVKVGVLFELLKATSHNGFPIISKERHLRGLILRKTLCALLKHKAFCTPDAKKMQMPGVELGANQVMLAQAATLFHDTLERNYPRFTKISEITLTTQELGFWVDLRPYMDTAPYSINESSSVQRCYRFFRTMGLRHLVVLDGDHCVTGIITRHDLTEHRLEHHWFQEGDNMQKFIVVDNTDSGVVVEDVRSDEDDAAALMEGGGLQLQTRRMFNNNNNSSGSGDDGDADGGSTSFTPLAAKLPVPPPLHHFASSSGAGAGTGDGGPQVPIPTPSPPAAAVKPASRSKVLKEPKSMKSNG